MVVSILCGLRGYISKSRTLPSCYDRRTNMISPSCQKCDIREHDNSIYHNKLLFIRVDYRVGSLKIVLPLLRSNSFWILGINNILVS